MKTGRCGLHQLLPAQYAGSLVTDPLQRKRRLGAAGGARSDEPQRKAPQLRYDDLADHHDSGGMMHRMRDTNQSRAYAARKASQAADKLITSTSDAERAQAKIWARLWGALAGYPEAKPSNDKVNQFP